jgi:sugar phosphate isomerase/epimerase
MMGFALGVVCVAFGRVPTTIAAARARALGFDHLDVIDDGRDASYALPIGDRIAFPGPRAGCTSPAPPKTDGAWERAVASYRRVGGARIEPWPGSILDSIGACEEMLAAVPGLTLTVDTGHVACWGEDPVELLPYAAHVQLRQARRGVAQALDGDVDFDRVVARLRELDYRGLLSIEYFDLPEMGWPLDDPVRYAVELAKQIRPLLR